MFKNFLHAFISQAIEKEDVVFEKSLRNNATPKLKGHITAGKLRWRGIYIVQNRKGEKWVEQRGKIISPVIYFNLELK